MTATELLAVNRPEQLFAGDPDTAKQQYRALARRWHPDHGGDRAVFAHISALYHSALERLKRGQWEGPQVLYLTDDKGKLHRLEVRASAPFALGQSLVGDRFAAWAVEPKSDFGPSLKRFLAAPTAFRYASAKMREEFERYLPGTPTVYRLDDGRYLVNVDKTPDLIRLRDVVTHMGALDPKAYAWVVSSLMNLACYLSYTGLTHNDISPDTYFISPPHHSGALLGGWWYSVARGERLREVPRRTHALLPFKVKVSKQASAQTDLELIRATVRECFGPMPAPMHDWAHAIGVGDARAQYEKWHQVLQQSFGRRRFIATLLDADAVYGSRTATI